MSIRSSFLVLASLVVTACGGSGDRCTQNSQCPAGEYCEPQLGVCLQPGEERDDEKKGSGGGTGGTSRSKIGAACTSHEQCGGQGFSCVDWPGGYCTKDCSNTSCGPGAACLSNGDLNACFATCSAAGSRSTCRAGYTCTSIQSKLVCVEDESSGGGGGGGGGGGSGGGGSGGGGGSTAKVAGKACVRDDECTGPSGQPGGCVAAYPGGYCTYPCQQTCISGAVCVPVNETLSLCLAGCNTNSDCRQGYRCMNGGDGNVCLPES